MTDKKLESFKIAATRKPGVRSPKKAEPDPAAGGARSLGFKRIEGLLESEERAAVQAGLAKLKDGLAELARTAKAAKDKAAARKAIAAVERTASLMDFLYDTKDSLAGARRG